MQNKELNRQIVRIAGPAIFGHLGFLLFDLIDIFWISSLGTDVIAGVASAGFLEGMMMSSMGMTYHGCASLVSQAFGAKNQQKAWDVVREAFLLSIVIGLILMCIFHFASVPLFNFMGLNDKALKAGWDYFQVIVYGLLPVFYVFMLTAHIFNAYGDTRTSVLILIFALALNAVLDPFFIFGWWIFPRWEAFGAAFATLISFSIGLLLRIFFLRKKQYIGELKTHLRWSNQYFSKILHVGIPIASARLIWASVYPMLATIITRFGMASMAGLTVAHRIEGFAYFSAVGFSVATSSLVGQNIGRQDFITAKRVAYQGRLLITSILIPISILFVAIPEWLISFASQDPEVIRNGASYLRIMGLLEVFLGWELIFEGAFNGLGHTRPYMLISIPLTLGRFPLAYILVNCFGFGLSAVWWAISISTALKGILLSRRFKKEDVFLDLEMR